MDGNGKGSKKAAIGGGGGGSLVFIFMVDEYRERKKRRRLGQKISRSALNEECVHAPKRTWNEVEWGRQVIGAWGARMGERVKGLAIKIMGCVFI